MKHLRDHDMSYIEHMIVAFTYAYKLNKMSLVAVTLINPLLAAPPKGRDFIWIEGEGQFTQEEMDEIEEYMWSGEIDLSTT